MNSLRAYLPSGSSRVFKNLDIQISVHGRALARLLSEGCGRIKPMKRRRVCLVPVGKASGSLDGPEKALRDAPPPAQRGFTQADQVNQLVWVSEVDADIGFMARLLALCSLPRSNPGNRLQYRRVNGPYTLIMTATGKTQAALRKFPPPVAGLGLDRSRADGTPRTGSGSFALGVHASTRCLQQQWRNANPPPQPDEAALYCSCAVGLRGSARRSKREFVCSRPQRVFGGTQSAPMSRVYGKAKFIWARRSSTRSSAIPCHSI